MEMSGRSCGEVREKLGQSQGEVREMSGRYQGDVRAKSGGSQGDIRGHYIVKIDLPKSQANMTADCSKTDSCTLVLSANTDKDI